MDNWLLAQTDHLVAASNFTVSILMLIIATSVIYALTHTRFSQQTDIKYMLMGIVFESLGWALHRFYWGVWRVYRLYGNDVMSQWFVEHAYYALVPAGMIMIGLIMIIGPIISIFFSKSRLFCYIMASCLTASIYWFMYVKLDDAFLAAKLRAEGLSIAKEKSEAVTKARDTLQPKIGIIERRIPRDELQLED